MSRRLLVSQGREAPGIPKLLIFKSFEGGSGRQVSYFKEKKATVASAEVSEHQIPGPGPLYAYMHIGGSGS